MSEGGIKRLLFENNNQNRSVQSQFSPSKLFQAGNNASSNVYQDSFEEEKKRAFDQGYQQAVAQAQQEWNEKISLINNLAEALDQPLKDIDHKVIEKSTELAIAIAKQIVRRELSLDSGQIVSAVKQAIELIPKDGEQINIYVNPKDDQHIKQLFSKDEKFNKYNVIQDPTISVGGCKASTDYSLVDLTIDKQIANIAAQIFGDQRNAAR
ncbi:MAG: FliH/SctL family protein [Gammaproteobacteria bacterium]|nr:FliH/SctL family protein [Gammaproteobacteria bacterium]